MTSLQLLPWTSERHLPLENFPLKTNLHSFSLRWLNTVSSTYIWVGRYNDSLSLDATIMASKNSSIIGEHVVIIFFTL